MNNEENTITAPMHLSLLDKQDLCDISVTYSTHEKLTSARRKLKPIRSNLVSITTN